MPEPRRTRIDGAIQLVGLDPDMEPDLEMHLVSHDGTRTPIKLDGYKFSISADRPAGASVEIRPAGAESGRRISADSLADHIKADGAWRIPQGAWELWPIHFTCVSGHVKRCRPWFWPLAIDGIALASASKASLASKLGNLADLQIADLIKPPPLIYPWRCLPVCRGKVEVFVRTCCCPPIFDPPIIIKDLCEIIDCDHLVPFPWPPKPPFPPDPPPYGPGDPEPWGPLAGPTDPVPWRPRPGVGPDLVRNVGRALARSAATEGGRDPELIAMAAEHIQALSSMSYAAGVEYIKLHPDLAYLHCSCTTQKVATVFLEDDGSFDACFLLPKLGPRCHRRVFYRVSQIQESGWVTIYDGLAKGESFPLSQDADLRANWLAEACHDPHEWGPTPFVLLEKIGHTWADNLIHSTGQAGEDGAGRPRFAGPLAATDGLVNPGPALTTAACHNQPWAQTLALFYQFHPGLQALGAKYYRTRIVPVNATGTPTGDGVVVGGDLSWRKYYDPPGPDSVGVQWVGLNNPAIGGVSGLYTIPYPDAVFPWLNAQAHAYVDTTLVGNGRHLIVVDIFNAAGQRLIPTGSLEAPGAGDAPARVAFEYRRLDGPIDSTFSNTSVVPHRQLASLFWIDNLPAFGDIAQINHNGAPSAVNCQFLVGPATDSVSLNYEAYQSDGFLWYSRIWYKQGLTGPQTFLPSVFANVGPPPQPSAALTFGALLGAEMRCAYAANLDVYVRHTDGWGRIEGFDRHDQAAFALERTT